MNVVVLVGNIGGELKLVKVGDSDVCKFSIAVAGRPKERPVLWVPIEVWGQLAETMARQLGKGDKVTVQGELEISEWTDKTGAKRKTTFVRCFRAQWSPKIVKNGATETRTEPVSDGWEH